MEAPADITWKGYSLRSAIGAGKGCRQHGQGRLRLNLAVPAARFSLFYVFNDQSGQCTCCLWFRQRVIANKAFEKTKRQ